MRAACRPARERGASSYPLAHGPKAGKKHELHGPWRSAARLRPHNVQLRRSLYSGESGERLSSLWIITKVEQCSDHFRLLIRSEGGINRQTQQPAANRFGHGTISRFAAKG